ncbi:MAG: apolipoprotein N-acyltransferase [Betaproteobacteria bacterium]|nr:MAG: apolipoprotein N-acyltransferase [Betaproteobacteria bacterium]
MRPCAASRRNHHHGRIQIHRRACRWPTRVASDGGAGLNVSRSIALAASAGAATAYLSFAPMAWWFVPYITIAVLCALVYGAANVRRAALFGFAFALAFFVVGVGWVRISLNEFGGMPIAMAWFAAIVFCSYLALFPMIACAVSAWAKPKGPLFFSFVFASAWTFTEYLRAHLFTGFEWLSIGASQAPSTLFSGIIPLFGGFGASFFVALVCGFAGVIIRAANHTSSVQRSSPLRLALVVAALLALPLGSKLLDFTDQRGAATRVSLLQGNIAQSLKWDPERFQSTLVTYEKLVREAKGELIILPETAIPTLLHRVPPEYIERLKQIAKDKRANLLVGVPIEDKGKFFNAAISLGVEPEQSYRKVHLVPFGEFMPLQGLLGWFYRNLQIPMSSFASGSSDQPLMKLNGQSLGISICYEDAFARDVHRTMPDATLLVNISNDAWFGKSAAAEQHLQLAQLRALEFARPMVRANNTGITAVIDAKGRVTQRIDSWQTSILETTVQGAKGYTPYMVWGDLPMLLVCLAGLGVGAARRWSAGKRTSAS